MNGFSVVDSWLGRKDSNLGMRRSKPRALPLGDDPNFSFRNPTRELNE